MPTNKASGSRVWKYLLCSAAAVFIVLGNFALHAPRSRPLLAPVDYHASGSFFPNGVPESTQWHHQEDREPSFGSSSNDEHRTGKLVSTAFAAPAILELSLSGYPSAEGNRLSLEAVTTGEKLALKIADDPGLVWRRYSWKLPESWQSRQVKLVAENDSAAAQGWLGMTLPHGATRADERKASVTRAVFVPAAIVWEGIVFLLPGMAMAWLLGKKVRLNEIQFACITLFGAATAGYLVFWFYLVGIKAGKDLSKAIVLLSAAIVIYAIMKRRMDTKLFREVVICALLMAALTLFYSADGFLYEHSKNAGEQAEDRFVDPLPLDNMLPYFFADKIYRSQSFRPFLTEGWQSSDRPPLQAGLTLLQLPLWETANRELRYQILSTFLQSMWLVAVWLLLRSMRLDRRSIVLVCAACVFSRFFLMNTFFTWPKLLAAAFFILALTLVRYPEGGSSRITPFEAAMIGAGTGLAMLSHTGVAFSVISLAIVLLVSRKIPSLRSLATGIAVLLLFFLPWMAYQKLYDPPGNRLVKWHLAGDSEIDSLSFSHAFVQGYRRLTPAQIVDNKIEDVRTLFGPGPWDAVRSGWRPTLNWYKTGAFFYVFQSPGLLNLGFIAFLLARFFSSKRGSSNPQFKTTLGGVQRLFIFFLVAMVVWSMFLYAPGSTQLVMGSMADEALLFVALAASLALAAPRLATVIIGFNVFVLFPLSALIETSTASSTDAIWAGGLDPSMAGLLVLSFLLMVYLGWKAGFSASGESLLNGREQETQIQLQAAVAKEL
jgi:hypothetical protein